jgi:hypothetical protein
MTQKNDPLDPREEGSMHWGLSYLREDIHELRREFRTEVQELRREVRELAREMNQRFNRQTATMIAIAAAIIAAVKL